MPTRLLLISVSLFAAARALAADGPVTITAGDRWKAIEHAHDVEPGSILDFSGLVDAPAGKHGHVVVKGPHFEFANRPGQRVRFYGANLCFSANFPEKDEAPRLADRLVRMGYNAVRLHHYDWDLVDKSAADSVTPDPKQLDKLENFIHCCKQRGLYVSIDLYTYREAKASEIPEVNRPVRSGYKALVPLLDSAMRNWQAFARNFLTHRNPYTGMTLAEDPVLIGICPLNEDTLWACVGDADVRKLYDERFEPWLKEKSIAPKDKGERDSAWTRFLCELQIDGNRRTHAFLKGLGVKAPLTGVNFIGAMALAPVRAELEYVDNHAYWDHPRFPVRNWSLPHQYGNRSPLAGGAEVPRNLLSSRIVGKPYTISEINYCFPNRWRAEGGPLLGAYASLQDWDGLWRFAWSHSINNTRRVERASGFDIVNQPLDQLSERIAILMFLRGDVAPAKRIIPMAVSDAAAYRGRGGFPSDFAFAGLHTGIGSMSGTAPGAVTPEAATLQQLVEAKRIAAGAVDITRRRAISDTGQIDLAGDAGTLRVVTDRTECFVLGSGELAGNSAAATVEGGPAVVSISSMDGQPIARSRRLLVLHLTDVQNSNIRYRDAAMTMLESWGDLPHLARVGTARVKLKGSGPMTVFAVDMTGKRRGGVAAQRQGEWATFTADTGKGWMAYEVVR